MPDLIERLQSLTATLREALSRHDWEAIGVLDVRCRVLISEVESSKSWSDPALHEQVGELSQLYVELHQSGRAERERLMGELTRLNQSRQMSQAYQPLG